MLSEDSGAQIFAALRDAAPGTTLTSARVDRARVTASFCAAADPSRCFTVELTDPKEGCDGAPAGPFCARFSDAATASARTSVASALGRVREDVWRDAETTTASKPSDAPSEPRPPPVNAAPPRHPFSTMLAILALPFALGFAWGRASLLVLRKLDRARGVVRVAMVALPLALAFVFIPSLPHLGAWDALSVAATISAGAALASVDMPRRALGRRAWTFGGVTLVTLLLLELATRALPAPAATFAAPDRAILWFDRAAGADACAPFFPDDFPGPFLSRTRDVKPPRPLTLHVGDSMVEGVGVPIEDAFPAVIGALDPSVDHVNAGFASSSTDMELAVVRAWTARLHVTRVVLYVFGFNDLAELDRALPCCDGGPLLDASPEAAMRCPTPGIASKRIDRFATSPAPYALRVATSFSAFARRAVVAFVSVSDLIARSRESAAVREGRRWDRLADLATILAREVKAKGASIVFVYLPARAALEAPAPKATGDYATRGRLVDLGAKIGVEVLDPWDLLEAAVKKDGADRWFFPAPNIHFTKEGHRLIGEWLAARLR